MKGGKYTDDYESAPGPYTCHIYIIRLIDPPGPYTFADSIVSAERPYTFRYKTVLFRRRYSFS